MYTSFFGLSDIPFSIAPNPEYLFLGDRHKEALSHLSYGLGDTGGFVLLTGEVGTGKTTLSRRLLEQLPDNTQVAFILNPTLSCIELLATICDELGVRYKKTGITLKYLTDKIQQKLLKNHEAAINTLLIIDEAQHLQPEVLEQLRLLTNLETNTKKLLQVVLIGQPELQQLLQRRDLRQLAQRITARYHLLPLTRQEVDNYIKHRLTVADCHRPLFKPNAVKLIHKISKGIPRLINLLCDRALATAYGNNESMVTRKTVQIASEQALGSEYQLTPWWQQPRLIGASVLANVVVVAALAYWVGSNQSIEQPSVESISVAAEKADFTSETSQAEPPKKESVAPHRASEQTAVRNVVNDTVNDAVNENLVQTKPVVQIAETVTNQSTSQDMQVAKQELTQQQSSQLAKATPAGEQVSFDVSSIDGVSEELLEQFQQAIKATDNVDIAQQPTDASSIPSLMDMPSYIQNKVPRLQFEVHMFITDRDSWIRVNGRERYEGDVVAGDVKLAKILQDKVILELEGEQFSLPALSNW